LGPHTPTAGKLNIYRAVDDERFSAGIAGGLWSSPNSARNLGPLATPASRHGGVRRARRDHGSGRVGRRRTQWGRRWTTSPVGKCTLSTPFFPAGPVHGPPTLRQCHGCLDGVKSRAFPASTAHLQAIVEVTSPPDIVTTLASLMRELEESTRDGWRWFRLVRRLREPLQDNDIHPMSDWESRWLLLA
jgi:hypothetical protein